MKKVIHLMYKINQFYSCFYFLLYYDIYNKKFKEVDNELWSKDKIDI